ncbi:DNA-binding transcriptional MocR family regulator [Methanofollis sp. W23]|uniref:aminotransferase-like domain-containing protein n=1 Tax=Methanofollis sp. W23 TaxID=2817849 RepID=UPI001AE8E0F2|nr:PLP-dependent aminotransferase family protein [Methanofollis sp. W23]MBP2146747.1 DNA-binding transcriptional MocR family regulator [Methanofollis sp. W23]
MVFGSKDAAALQYAATEGHLPLREFIAGRDRQRLGLEVGPEEILITSGSQQALDLIGKVVLDPGDAVATERPGYLGAIQAFSLYEPRCCPAPLEKDGPDLGALERGLDEQEVRLFYGVPNSQNPSEITPSREKREDITSLLDGTGTLFVEDDAYGGLRFSDRAMPPVKRYLPDTTILTGSFSKVAAPGLRVGWICAEPAILEPLVVAKQASDLHSSTLDQRIHRPISSEHRCRCACQGDLQGLRSALRFDNRPDR